jgi:predicted transcriptional regulator
MTAQSIVGELHAAGRAYEEWAALTPILGDPTIGIHLAVMLEPFLTYILDGRKTIESRFSKNAIAPYERVAEGDLVLLKAGPVVGSFRVSSVECVVVEDKDFLRIRRIYGKAICAEDDEFWEARAGKRHVTLIGVSDVRRLTPVPVSKRDMRGWVTLTAPRRSFDYLPVNESQKGMYVQITLPFESAL